MADDTHSVLMFLYTFTYMHFHIQYYQKIVLLTFLMSYFQQ